MKPVRRTTLLAVSVGLALIGCGEGLGSDDRCLVDLAPITVRSNVLSVGDTVTFNADLGPAQCLPSDITTEDWRWFSGDSLIVRIDSLSGVAEGISPGEVQIEVRHALDPSVSSGIGVLVVPANALARKGTREATPIRASRGLLPSPRMQPTGRMVPSSGRAPIAPGDQWYEGCAGASLIGRS